MNTLNKVAIKARLSSTATIDDQDYMSFHPTRFVGMLCWFYLGYYMLHIMYTSTVLHAQCTILHFSVIRTSQTFSDNNSKFTIIIREHNMISLNEWNNDFWDLYRDASIHICY